MMYLLLKGNMSLPKIFVKFLFNLANCRQTTDLSHMQLLTALNYYEVICSSLRQQALKSFYFYRSNKPAFTSYRVNPI